MSNALTHLDTSTQITIRRSDGEAQNAKNILAACLPEQLADIDPGAEKTLCEQLNGEVSPATRPLGAYLHVPFCFHKCHYCDFYSIVDSRDRQGAFTQRLIAEIAAASELLPRRPETIFVGGGTPTLLAPHWWERLLAAVGDHLIGETTSEITVEANPETVTAELADRLASGGVNRLSIGAQSFNPAHLKTLERWHEPASVDRSVAVARDAGITNINLDLIFGIPGQTIDDWRDDLRRAIALEPTHLSCYGLMYELNTPLTKRMQRGSITPIDDEVEAAMYELTRETLHSAGFEQYEISAWAMAGQRCQHNLTYWRNGDWWPLGPSASGHLCGLRWKNVARLAEYLATDGLPPVCDIEKLDDDGRVGETLMLGLRLLDGIPIEVVDRLLALGTRGRERGEAIARHLDDGLLVREGGSLRLTVRGLLVADSVISDLL